VVSKFTHSTLLFPDLVMLLEFSGIIITYKVSYLWCLLSYRKNIGVQLKRNAHSKQRLGFRSRKNFRPNFGRDSGLIKTEVSVSVSGSRRALQWLSGMFTSACLDPAGFTAWEWLLMMIFEVAFNFKLLMPLLHLITRQTSRNPSHMRHIKRKYHLTSNSQNSNATCTSA
jgi:hypothetical protein